MAEKVFIYGDEFGTSTLKKNDVKNITHFIYTAIVIKESNKENALKVRDYISDTFFQGQLIKSSSKSLKNIANRIKALEYLVNNLNFIAYVFVIDKDKLDKEKGGLRFKEVFYKYFQKIFISQIKNSFSDFEIHMDNLINEKYQIELKNYLSQNYQDNFFEKYNISDDKKEPLIQLADLLAGSFGRVFNLSFASDKNEELFELLRQKTANFSFFPVKEETENKIINEDSEVDDEIYKIVRNDVESIFEIETDEIIKSILEYLLWHQKVLPYNFIQTYEIINIVKQNIGKEVSVENLYIIIRDLRYKGAIIVSSANKSGYKLAVNKSDVYIYFGHYLKHVIPMLKKVEIANSIFMNKTVGDFIPLDQMDELKNLVETLSKNNDLIQ